jgi:hypothetical protein
LLAGCGRGQQQWPKQQLDEFFKGARLPALAEDAWLLLLLTTRAVDDAATLALLKQRACDDPWKLVFETDGSFP